MCHYLNWKKEKFLLNFKKYLQLLIISNYVTQLYEINNKIQFKSNFKNKVKNSNTFNLFSSHKSYLEKIKNFNKTYYNKNPKSIYNI